MYNIALAKAKIRLAVLQVQWDQLETTRKSYCTQLTDEAWILNYDIIQARTRILGLQRGVLL